MKQLLPALLFSNSKLINFLVTSFKLKLFVLRLLIDLYFVFYRIFRDDNTRERILMLTRFATYANRMIMICNLETNTRHTCIIIRLHELPIKTDHIVIM